MANGEETQFSTYKIDYHEIARHHTITWNEESPTYARDVRDFLLREMKKSIEKRHQSEVVLIEKGNFKGFIYKTSHFPEWRDMAISLLSDCAIDDMQYETWLKNINVSYVLLCVHEKNIYAIS